MRRSLIALLITFSSISFAQYFPKPNFDNAIDVKIGSNPFFPIGWFVIDKPNNTSNYYEHYRDDILLQKVNGRNVYNSIALYDRTEEVQNWPRLKAILKDIRKNKLAPYLYIDSYGFTKNLPSYITLASPLPGFVTSERLDSFFTQICPLTGDSLVAWAIADEPHYAKHNFGGLNESEMKNMYDLIKLKIPLGNKNTLGLLENWNGWSNDFKVRFVPSERDSLSVNGSGFSSSGDILLSDQYPICPNNETTKSQMKLIMESLVYLKENLNKFENGNQKPIIQAIQGYGEKDEFGAINMEGGAPLNKRNPSSKELEYMVLTSIIHGARGIYYWAAYTADSEIRSRILRVSDSLFNILNLPEILQLPKMTIHVSKNINDKYCFGYDGGIMPKYNEWSEPIYADHINYISRLDAKKNELYIIISNDFAESKSSLKINLPFKIDNVSTLTSTVIPFQLSENTITFPTFNAFSSIILRVGVKSTKYSSLAALKATNLGSIPVISTINRNNEVFSKISGQFTRIASVVSGNFDLDSDTELAINFSNGSTSVFDSIAIVDLVTGKIEGKYDLYSGNIPIKHMVAGDFNGDGIDDLAFNTGTTSGLFYDWVTIRTAKTGGIISEFDLYPNQNIPIKHMIVGDFVGDSKKELAFNTGTSSGAIYDWVTVRDINGAIMSEFDAYTNQNIPIKHMIAGDFSGDSKDEIAMNTGNVNGTVYDWVTIRNYLGIELNAFDVYPNQNIPIKHMVAGDFDGDGKMEIALNTGNVNGTVYDWVTVRNNIGAELNSFDVYLNQNIPIKLMISGDFNGDGKDEIAMNTGNVNGSVYDRITVREPLKTQPGNLYEYSAFSSAPDNLQALFTIRHDFSKGYSEILKNVSLENVFGDQTEISNKISISVYPNPFNPSATISFNVPVAQTVSVKVYNSIGQQVAELVKSQEFSEGNHSLTFDGSKYASGIYFCQIQIGQTSRIMKMMLLK